MEKGQEAFLLPALTGFLSAQREVCQGCPSGQNREASPGVPVFLDTLTGSRYPDFSIAVGVAGTFVGLTTRSRCVMLRAVILASCE